MSLEPGTLPLLDNPILEDARTNAVKRRRELDEKLGAKISQPFEYASDTASLVVFGSLARDEWTTGSDLDWTYPIDGQANSDHLHIAQEIEGVLKRRKRVGRTASDLAAIFAELPKARLCFDIGHARQVDPTMSEAAQILLQCKDRLRQLHISEVNGQSKHDPLSLEAVMAFRRVTSLIPSDVPIILESRVAETRIQHEIDNAIRALDPSITLAIAGD